jgi:tRNA pseudouridine32 synthase/23S rRNA pseudouridine746 synthase
LVLNAQGESLSEHNAFVAHSTVHYYRELEHEQIIPFQQRILFQDDYLLVADKPHFLPVIPAGRFLQETLLVRLKRSTGITTLAPIHRLDRETAGIVLFSIQPETRGAYQQLFQLHRVHKTYHALAGIHPENNFPLRVQSRIAESDNFMQMQIVNGNPNTDTQIELLEQRGNVGRYELKPVTGKKHQLRVQMAALGVPIINDQIYPNVRIKSPEDFKSPLQLLAKGIKFTDPINGDKRMFESLQQLAWPE